MYITLASVAAGVTVSTVRWAVIDTIHRWTGLAQPTWDFSRLQDKVTAYNVLNEIHYRYYLFHSNVLVALIFVYLARRIHLGVVAEPFGWFDLGFVLLLTILFVGSRDNLRKYYERVAQLLGTTSSGQSEQQDWAREASRQNRFHCPRCSRHRLPEPRRLSSAAAELTSSTFGDLKGDTPAGQSRRIPEQHTAGR